MNQPRLVVLFSLLFGCLLASSAFADDSFKWPNLNPFAKKKSASATIGDSGGATTIPAAGGSMDDIPAEAPQNFKTSKTIKSTPAKPTTWQKWNAGTQAFLSKTSTALNPWAKKKSPPPTPVTGTRKVYNGSSMAPKQKEKSSIFGSMFGGASKKEKEPETVDEFIGQPRVPF